MLFVKRNISVLVLIAFIIVLISLAGCADSSPTGKAVTTDAEDNVINLGVILALSGRAAAYGEKVRIGMDIALEELKNNPSMQGRQINLIYEDSQGDPRQAVTALHKLISIDQVPVVIGPLLSESVLAAAPIAESEKIILFVPGAGTDKIKEAGDYIFRIRMSASYLSAYFANYLYHDMNIKEISVLYANSENAISYKDAFLKTFENMGGKITFIQVFNNKEKDFRTLIMKIKQNKAENIFMTGYDQEIAYFLKQSNELGLDINVFATPAVETDALLEIAGDSAEGLIFCSESIDIESEDPRVQEFRKKYKSITNAEPNFFSANGYDALNIIVLAGNKYSFSAEGIKKGLYEMTNYPGVGGLLSFDEYGEVTKPLMIKTVRNGKYVEYN